eukprot:1156546-Pelagomonas_calceolata.AAC.8
MPMPHLRHHFYALHKVSPVAAHLRLTPVPHLWHHIYVAQDVTCGSTPVPHLRHYNFWRCTHGSIRGTAPVPQLWYYARALPQHHIRALYLSLTPVPHL